MQKFGLFDLIEKLAPLQKAISSIENTTKNTPKKTEQNVNNSVEKPTKKANVSSVIFLINRHNEISKRIDMSAKK